MNCVRGARKTSLLFKTVILPPSPSVQLSRSRTAFRRLIGAKTKPRTAAARALGASARERRRAVVAQKTPCIIGASRCSWTKTLAPWRIQRRDAFRQKCGDTPANQRVPLTTVIAGARVLFQRLPCAPHSTRFAKGSTVFSLMSRGPMASSKLPPVLVSFGRCLFYNNDLAYSHAGSKSGLGRRGDHVRDERRESRQFRSSERFIGFSLHRGLRIGTSRMSLNTRRPAALSRRY